jgi:serine/threonine-protein kinase
VLSALESAHAKGIVHRDLKPANIFLSSSASTPDYVKLVDFGISKVRSSEDDLTRGLTRTGMLLGTPTYMSPEQAMGEEITHSTDIFSAGVILYEMLTGTLPFQDHSIAGLLFKIIGEEPTDPLVLRPDLPPELADVIAAAMAKKPEHRFQTVAEFRRVITPYSPDTALLAGLATTRMSARAADMVEGFARESRGSLTAGRATKDAAMTTPLELATTKETKSGGGRLPIVLGAVAGGLAIAVAVLFVALKTDLLSGAPSPEPVAAPAPTAAAPTVMPTAPPPPPPSAVEAPAETRPAPAAEEPEKKRPKGAIYFSARVEPAYAVVSIDGKKVGRGTFRIERREDGKEHDVLVEAPGYRDHRVKARFDDDVEVVVELERGSSRRRGGDRSAREPEPEAPAAVIVPEEPKPAKTIVITREPEPEPKPEPKGRSKKDRIIDESAPWD